MTPGNNLGPYNNSAIASGTSPSSANVSDSSDHGADPESNNGSGGVDDPTPVTFSENPSLALAKALTAPPTNQGDGSYQFSYTIVVKNNGDIQLNELQVVDDLATTFAAASFTVTALSATNGLNVNSNFDGDQDKNLLGASQSLAVGITSTLTLSLSVTPGNNLGPYENQAC